MFMLLQLCIFTYPLLLMIIVVSQRKPRTIPITYPYVQSSTGRLELLPPINKFSFTWIYFYLRTRIWQHACQIINCRPEREKLKHAGNVWTLKPTCRSYRSNLRRSWQHYHHYLITSTRRAITAPSASTYVIVTRRGRENPVDVRALKFTGWPSLSAFNLKLLRLCVVQKIFFRGRFGKALFHGAPLLTADRAHQFLWFPGQIRSPTRIRATKSRDKTPRSQYSRHWAASRSQSGRETCGCHLDDSP